MDELEIINRLCTSNIVRHSSPYILLCESLITVFKEFLKRCGIVVHNMKELKRVSYYPATWKHWKYCGGSCGKISGFFNGSSDYYITTDKTNISISKYDLPHFFADNVNINEFVEFLKEKNKYNEFVEKITSLNIDNDKESNKVKE